NGKFIVHWEEPGHVDFLLPPTSSASSPLLPPLLKKVSKVLGQSAILSQAQNRDPPTRRERQRDVTDRVHQHFRASELRSNPSRPPPDAYYRSSKPGAIDARKLAAVPNPSPPPPGRSIGEGTRARRAPFDARRFDADRSDNAPRPLRTRTYVGDRPRENRGPRILFRRDASDAEFEGGSTNAQHNRVRGGQGRPKSGSRESQKSSRAFRTAPSGGGDRGRETGDKPTAEELEYLSTRDSGSSYGDTIYENNTSQHTRANDQRTYTPVVVSTDTLQGLGPTLACGEWGMSETVGERLIQVNQRQEEYHERIEKLAKTWEEGAFCQFRSRQEKADTLRLVERNLAGQGDNAPLIEEKEKEKMALMDTRMKEEREKLATRLLKGDYYIGPLGKGPTAELLERYTRKNETYLPKDGQALAGKVGTLLPLDNAASSATTTTART
ncbi:MAG: hypothetical protein Q9181_006363, partial [Wetmoreana brouardii]